MAMDLTQTQIDSQQEEYWPTCAKCRHDGGSGIICDGVWYFDSKELLNEDLSSLYCCTGCISWFRRNAKNWFKDDIQRKWFRFTKSEMKNWSRASWIGSEEKTLAFVEEVTKKKEDKKSQSSSKKASSRSDGLPAISSVSTAVAASTPRRKRKRLVETDPASGSPSNFVVGRYDPRSTFDSFQQGIKTVYAFLNMCNNTEPASNNHVPASVHSIVTMQIRLLERLMQTLQEHITFETK